MVRDSQKNKNVLFWFFRIMVHNIIVLNYAIVSFVLYKLFITSNPSDMS